MEIIEVNLFLTILVFSSQIAFSKQLIVGIGKHYTAPFIVKNGEKVESGIIFDIFQEVAKIKKYGIKYVSIPRNRVESFLERGSTHVLPRSNPAWLNFPNKFDWSAPWAIDSNRFVTLKGGNQTPIKSLNDLFGKNLGTITGYRYKKLQPFFSSGKILRDDAKTMDANFSRLRNGWIPSLIDSEFNIKFYLRSNPTKYEISDFALNTFEISSVFSKKSPLSPKDFNLIIKNMKSSGKLERIFEKYR